MSESIANGIIINQLMKTIVSNWKLYFNQYERNIYIQMCGVPYKNKITNISLKARRETWKEVKYEISSCLSGITNVLSVFSNASARFQIPPVV